MPAPPTGAGKRAAFTPQLASVSSNRRARRHARVLQANALESRWRRGLQHRRPEVRLLPGVRTPDHQSGHQLLDNCRGIVPGTASTAVPGGVGRVVARRRPTHTRASRLTGRAPGSYPGTDWVRGPGRAPSRRSSASWSAGLSSRRSRVRVPSVARSSTWPNGQGTGLRIRRLQVRLLPSTPTRRSSAEQSTAFRRRGSHVRIVPARPALPAQPEETPRRGVRTRS